MTERRVFPHKRSIGVSFPYDPATVARIKGIGGGKWNPEEKIWVFSRSLVRQVVDACEPHDFDIHPDIADLADKAPKVCDVETHRGGIRVRKGLTLPPHIKGENSGAWTLIPVQFVEDVVIWARENGHEASEDVVRLARTRVATETRNYRLSTSIVAPPIDVDGLMTTPLPEQWVPVNHALSNPKFLLADEQGLGKTLEALMVARVSDKPVKKLVIACPDSLTDNWITEMNLHFEEGTFIPHIAKTQTPYPIDEDVDTIIIGWSILSFWVDALLAWGYDMVIADEGHYAKSGRERFKIDQDVKIDQETGQSTVVKTRKKVSGSQRGSAIHELLSALGADDRALLLTGTPIPNRPLELLPILEALGAEGMFGGSFAYKMRYCGAYRKFIGLGRGIRGEGYVWDYSGASNLLELNSRLRASGYYVRRTKEHLVNKGALPKKIVDGVEFFDRTSARTPTHIQGREEDMHEYMKREAQLQGELIEFVREKGGRLTKKVLRQVAAQGHKKLEAIVALRRLAGMAAIPGVTERAQMLLDEGEKVVIVAHHRDVVDAYEEAFEGAVKIQGGMNTRKIEEAKAKFNAEGMDHPVLVMSLEAGKTGHTLCKQPDQTCAHILFAEQAWTPGDDRQAQDRIWRIGQNRDVSVTNIFVPGTINESMYLKRLAKERVVDAVVDSLDEETESGDSKAMAGAFATELVRRGLA